MQELARAATLAVALEKVRARASPATACAIVVVVVGGVVAAVAHALTNAFDIDVGGHVELGRSRCARNVCAQCRELQVAIIKLTKTP